MIRFSRRRLLEAGLAASTSAVLPGFPLRPVCAGLAQPASPQPGERLPQDPGVAVLTPCDRTVVSHIIDDSTCLVNLAYYGIPQFAATWPDRAAYQKPWQSFPREIPDAFVRKFAEWSAEHGVKGKYSVVPYPACVGWVDRFLPGWSQQALRESLSLVREAIVPNWDIHPEMVSHTRVIDTRTGRPYESSSPDYMENWGWSQTKSAEELAEYMAYALRILKNVDLPCAGVTTPGGFGSRVPDALAHGTLLACREVFDTPIAHYFRDLFTDDRSVAPRVYYAADLRGDDPHCVVSIIGCTGDWFGGWDGDTPGDADRMISPDLETGRLVDVLERGEPAIMVCHWPGIYYNGRELGFRILKTVVDRLQRRYDRLLWMKLSEIARYWAAKELTGIVRHEGGIELTAPFAAPAFTFALELEAPLDATPAVRFQGRDRQLDEVPSRAHLRPGTWCTDGRKLVVCFDLPRGTSYLRTSAVQSPHAEALQPGV